MSPIVHRGEPIAIIGSGCRFPGGTSSPSKLWELLSKPRDVLSEIPPTRFNPHGFYHPDSSYSGHSNVLHSYILEEDHRLWDADFFNVSAQESAAIDPQQRLLMECVYEALENGGLQTHNLRGSDTAVYVGLMSEEYSDIQLRELNTIPTYFPTGTARSIVANRISYFFDWRGASMTIDTACSSSLVAVHQAVQVLRSGASRIAIAAGTNLILGPEPYIAESSFNMLSPSGRSRMWADGADGYGRGDGVAAVVLKRLSDAVADGDYINSIIRETGVNQDGRTNGITVPNADSQITLIEDTYRRAGLDLNVAADRPQFFEAHGTGTPAGDPIEAEAIHRAIGQRLGTGSGSTRSTEKLFVGSIKSVIGHTEGTAGLAGLLKVSLALQHGQVPPNMLFDRLNPAIRQFYGGLEVPVDAVPWPTNEGQLRRASVNSFGFGGTNAHAIIESYRSRPIVAPKFHPLQATSAVPYTFSAASQHSLKRVLQELVLYLDRTPETSLHDLAFTLNVKRSILPVRLAVTGRDLHSLKKKIEAFTIEADWDFQTKIVRGPPKTRTVNLGIFTGQGAQWAGMGKQLFDELSFVRARIQDLGVVLETLPADDRPSWSLTQELLETSPSKSRLHLAEIAQPLTTAVQIILVDLLAAANVHFGAVVGHSSGEIAAAYAAGVLSACDAMKIAYYRGLCSSQAGAKSCQTGSMMAVGTSLDDAKEIISLPQFEGRLSVAAHNAPTSTTLSGDSDAIQEAQVVFQDEGKFARILRVDKAYHSHHMQPCVTPYLEALKKAAIQASEPRQHCQWYSSVYDGAVITSDAKEDLNGIYWVRNMEQPVLFSRAIEKSVAVADHPFSLAIEIGPHSALRGPVAEILEAMGKPLPTYIACLQRDAHSSDSFGDALGRIWAESPEGIIDLDNFQTVSQDICPESRDFLPDMPKYPWDNRRIFWHESRRSRVLRARPASHPLLGTPTPDSNESTMTWHSLLRVADLPWLSGHKIQGEIVFPAAGYIVLAVEAAKLAWEGTPKMIELRNVSIGKAVLLGNDKSGVEVLFSIHINQTTVDKHEKNTIASFHARSASVDGVDTTLHASGEIYVSWEDPGVSAAESWGLPNQGEAPPSMVDVDQEKFYAALVTLGYQYSPPFRALTSMKRRSGYGQGRLVKPTASEMHLSQIDLLIDPSVLDSAFQSIFLAYSWPDDGRLWSLHVPVSIQSIRIDATQYRLNSDEYLGVESTITKEDFMNGRPEILGDVNIFTEHGRQVMLQVEGFRIVPFSPASEAQDTQMFFTNISGVAFPDGELATNNGMKRATAEEFELGRLLERISHFYLKCLVNEITPAEESQAEWHHRKLMDFARHVTEMVRQGTHPYCKVEWADDTMEILRPLLDIYGDKIDLRLMRSVGEHLPEAVRGETIIIEHMIQDGMLNQYYVEALGLQQSNTFLSEIIGQMTHINPRLRFLELGAGTGAATKSILRRINDSFEHYTFTDVSHGFFEAAGETFQKQLTSGCMTLEVLDVEQDILSQGFQEQSYDVLVASLVLHATMDLKRTLRNVQRLLKPGGFLVMTEVTSNATTRLSLAMGGLEGWWVGSETGRTWSPCVSAAAWHDLLLQSGFSGIETSTPELDELPCPFSVLVSRAVDERIKLLIEPTLEVSPLSSIPELVIVAGDSLATVRLATSTAHILRPHCPSIKTMTGGLAALVSLAGGTGRLDFLILADLDRPIFEGLSPASFDGLKVLFAHARSLLWVTSGARCERPYSHMSLGACRAMSMEQSNLRMQFIDYSTGTFPDARTMANDFLRLNMLTVMEDDAKSPCYLWTREPEVTVDARGRSWVPRIKPHTRLNDCYNSSRRTITKDLDPAYDIIEVLDDEIAGRCLIQKWNLEMAYEGADFVRVRSLFSISLGHIAQLPQRAYASICKCLASGRHMVALSIGLKSIMNIKKMHTIAYNYPMDEAPKCLLAIASKLLATAIRKQANTDTTTLIVEPTKDIADLVTNFATDKGLKFSFVSSSPSKHFHPFTYIHPRATLNTISRCLTSDIADIIVFPEEKGDILTQRLKTCLPGPVRVRDVASLLSPKDFFAFSTDLESLASWPPWNSLDAVVTSIREFASTQHVPNMVVIDWTQHDKIRVGITPSDASPLLRANRTYLLVGLAGKGGIGLSLAEYLARQGARYIIMTSRTPCVDNKVISSYAEQGIRIQTIANDVTNEALLRSLVDDVRNSGSWPPIAGVVNGAMLLNDIALENMSYDQMMRVLKPKVDGTRYLDKIFAQDKLDFFILLSSLSCVFGREGQANYDAANMYLVSLAAYRRARGVCASVIDIGAIMGIGYMAREATERTLAQLLSAGYRKLSERDFHIAFTNAIIVGSSHTEDPELIMGLHCPGQRAEGLAPAWKRNPRFAHVAHLRQEKTGTSRYARTPSYTLSLQELLRKAQSPKEVTEAIRDAVISKVGDTLHLDDESLSNSKSLLQRRTNTLGIDSLVAVEIRSWILRELGVKIPILKILSDATILEIVNFAIENLPGSATPNIRQLGINVLSEAISENPAASIQEISQQGRICDGEVPQDLRISTPNVKPSVANTLSLLDMSDSSAESVLHNPTPPSVSSTHTANTTTWPMDKVVPMSYGQSRFWLMSRVVENPMAFNVTCNIEIRGEIDLSTMSNAVRSLGARHEALRTRFFIDEDNNHQLVQGILKDSPLHLEIELATDDDAERLFQQVHQTVYELEKGELLRIVLISITNFRHRLIIGYHHINMDSFSLAVLVNDLQRLYDGHKLPLPHVQSSDFALYQIERLRHGQWDDQISFWKKEMSPPPEPIGAVDISIRQNRPRPDRISYKIHSTKTKITTKVARQIQSLCRNSGVTAFQFYTTVLQILICRLTSTEDICIGMADANRGELDALDSIGNFLNLLPVRLQTVFGHKFEILLKNTKEKILQVMSNSAVPFDVILQHVQPQRSATYSPLFQVFIDYRQATQRLPWGQGTLEGKEYLLSKVPYDITLDIIDTPVGEASLEMMVQDGLYTPKDCTRLLECYITLLSSFTENSRLEAGEAKMFNSHETQAALRLGHGELLELGHTNVLPILDGIATSQPLAIALEDTAGRSVSWSQLIAKSVGVARLISKLNISARSRIGILQEPSVDWIYSMLGVWRSGNVYVPLDLSQGMQRLGIIVKAAQLSLILIHDATRPLVPQLRVDSSVRVVSLSEMQSAEHQTAFDLLPKSSNDEAIVIYTSGSTGNPKGVIIPHRVVLNAAQGILHQWPMHRETVLQQSALSFDLSWLEAILGLFTKGKVVVTGRAARADPQELTNFIMTKDITLTIATPTEATAWLQNGNLAAMRSSKWAWHITAGETLSHGLIKHLQILNKESLRVLNAYGPTETMVPLCHEVSYENWSAADMPVPIGRVMPNYTARVVNAQGQPVPAGVPGQLVFGGAGIACGYAGNEALTMERFPRDVFAGPGALRQGWEKAHMSGDRGYIRETDGAFMFMGRLDGDTQIKLRGLRIDLLEIEANIISTASGHISEAVVHIRRPQEHDPSSHHLASCVVFAQSSTWLRETDAQRDTFLRQVLRDLPLPDSMRPVIIAAVARLPRTRHGKLDRKASDNIDISNHTTLSRTGIISPDQTNLEKMRAIWLGVLGEMGHSSPLEANADFFFVGGNSLLLIRLQGELKTQFGLDTQLVTLFQNSTLTSMASLLGTHQQEHEDLGIDFAEEAKLQTELMHIRFKHRPLPAKKLVVALTGASGFLGQELIKHMLTLPEISKVYCVAVRNPRGLSCASSPNVTIYPGDLSLPNLGMADDAISEVFSSADIVVHNGADTSFLKSYSTVRATNLESTKTIIRHVLHYGHVIHLHFISTAGISTLISSDLYEEPIVSPIPRSATEGYILSKLASEQYLENTNARTLLPITIHRPTSIIGPGAPSLDVISNVLRFSEHLRAVPAMSALEGTFQFVQVHDLAQDIISDILSCRSSSSSSSTTYRNHPGSQCDIVNIRDFGAYMGRTLRTNTLPKIPDIEWISRAEAFGMPPEVARYLQGMNLEDRNGLKWTFPMVFKGPRPS